jgi:hypothetical protein
MIIAGRNAGKFETLLNDTPDDALLERVNLTPFLKDESRTYFREKQHKLALPTLLPEELAQRLLFLSNNKPILLGLAVEWIVHRLKLDWLSKMSPEELTTLPEEEIAQLQKNFEIELVKRIAGSTTKIHWVFLIMAWVYPLDCAMLAAIWNTSIEDTQEILNEARTYVFVKQLPNNSQQFSVKFLIR